MVYLGNQIQALNDYSREAICWLGVKLKGRKTKLNSTGYSCGNPSCYSCEKSNIRSGIDQAFRDLFTEDIMKKLIESKPKELKDLNDTLKSQFTSLRGKTAKDFKENANKIFVKSGYSDWFSKDETLGEKWNYRLARLLNIHTCTYCNREYVFVIRNPNKGKGMVSQFDHWFPKNDYPLLALSFYNLIPSCGTCNGIKASVKLDLDDHLHPYVHSNISNAYQFSFLPKTNKENYIVFKNNNSMFNTKGIDTVNALNLPLIYKGHSDKELQDLIDLRYKYSDNYLNILLENTFKGINISKEERYRLIFGIEIEEDNYHKRIFSKFKRDIINQLLSIKN
ncbi:hypothetical protein [Mangrovimonas xylaniphaga]|uniref:hypothetical protein n=1 Tax=Mangrovimonas xylaniphaga TaxID=1645915 RepID=UPI0006B401E0|nr:hypothetical protein [Mangrovimonas xylaniphaga]